MRSGQVVDQTAALLTPDAQGHRDGGKETKMVSEAEGEGR